MIKKVLKYYLFPLLLAALLSCEKSGETPSPEPDPQPSVFAHPGILINSADILRMKEQISSGIYPVYETYQALCIHSLADPSYQIKGPFEYLNRDTGGNGSAHENDFAAAWFLSVRWTISGDVSYGDKALEILYSYARILKGFEDGANDNPLCAGFDAYHIAKTAELLRYTGYLESTSDTEASTKLDAVDAMLLGIFVPMLDWFYSQPAYANGNWGAVITRAYMAIAIHSDNQDMFEKARAFYLEGEDNGCVKHYILPSGQCQESGRDQRHAQLGLGALAETCEMAYKQGDETLYSAYDNLLLTGFEYTAKYNIGLSVLFVAWAGDYGVENWDVISSVGRGDFLPYYEVVYNHYCVRKGIKESSEFTAYVLEEGGDRPEVGLSSSVIQFTFGSMLYYMSK